MLRFRTIRSMSARLTLVCFVALLQATTQFAAAQRADSLTLDRLFASGEFQGEPVYFVLMAGDQGIEGVKIASLRQPD